jgi:hypothetical protein
MDTFVVSEDDLASFFNQQAESSEEEGRDLFADFVSRFKLGSGTLDGDILELSLFQNALTEDQVRQLWTFYRQGFLSEMGRASLGSDASLTADSLVYTHKGVVSESATGSLSATHEALKGGQTDFLSDTTVTAKSGSIQPSTALLEAKTGDFIQSHKNKQWARSVQGALAAISEVSETGKGAEGALTAAASISSAVVSEVHGGNAGLNAFAYMDGIPREADASISASGALTADPGIEFEGGQSIASSASLLPLAEVVAQAVSDASASASTATDYIRAREDAPNLSATATTNIKLTSTLTSTAGLNSSGSLLADPTATFAGLVGLTGTGSLTGDISGTLSGVTTLNVTGSITGSVEVEIPSSSAISGLASVSAIGTVDDGTTSTTEEATATLAASSAMSATLPSGYSTISLLHERNGGI